MQVCTIKQSVNQQHACENMNIKSDLVLWQNQIVKGPIQLPATKDEELLFDFGGDADVKLEDMLETDFWLQSLVPNLSWTQCIHAMSWHKYHSMWPAYPKRALVNPSTKAPR